MPDSRKHRGAAPEDAAAFGADALPRLREAAADFCWLLSRGYAHRSGIKIVGDRHALTERRRMAVQRGACSDAELSARRAREVPQVADAALWLDGYNVLTTVEAALAGGVVLPGRDGTFRDLASMHGHFKMVAETAPALEAVGQTLERLGPREVVWLLDRPVSNSGRLAALIARTAAAQGWPWRVELVQNPDPLLAAAQEIVATADSMVLDRCARWFNLAAEVVRTHAPGAWLVRLFGG
jgi:hypothetical protein